MGTLIAVAGFVSGYFFSRKIHIPEDPKELLEKVQVLKYDMTSMVKEELEAIREAEKKSNKKK